MRALAFLGLLAVGLAACGTHEMTGGGSVAPPADAGPVAMPATDAGTPVVDGGSAQTDAGTAGIDGGGTKTPDGGTATDDGGTATNVSDGGSMDAGTTVAGDCPAMQATRDPGPAAASHFIWFHDSQGQSGCATGVTSGTGTLALEMAADHFGTLDFVSPSGALVRSITAEPWPLFGGVSGFIGYSTASMTSSLQAWDDTGAQIGSTPVQGAVLIPAEDPLGGAVQLFADTLTGYDPSLAVRWSVSRPPDYPVALAVDRAGATLYLFDGTRLFGTNTLAGMWVDHAGRPQPAFQMLGPQRDLAFRLSFTMTQRTGSGLFLALGGAWVAQIDSLATSSSKAPEWLQARPNTTLHMVHGGTGYAVMPAPRQQVQDCAQSVEVVSPSGASCGTTTFRAAAGACTTSAITVGYDGTVVQLAPGSGSVAHAVVRSGDGATGTGGRASSNSGAGFLAGFGRGRARTGDHGATSRSGASRRVR